MTKKRALIALSIATAVLVIFCLWYTRPRTFEDLLDGRTITDFAASGCKFSIRNGIPHADAFSIDCKQQGSQVIDDMAELMADSRYRVQLLSLLPLPSLYREDENTSSASVNMSLVLDDGSPLFICYLGNQVHFYGDSTFIATAVEDQTAELLFSYLSENGVRG